MKPEQLDTIIDLAVPDLRERLGELHEHILEAANRPAAPGRNVGEHVLFVIFRPRDVARPLARFERGDHLTGGYGGTHGVLQK